MPTITHLRRKSIKSVSDFSRIGGIKYKIKTYYFCGPAKNMTISAETIEQTTCKKCLKFFRDFYDLSNRSSL